MAAARQWLAAVAAVDCSGVSVVLETIVNLSSDSDQCLMGLVTSLSSFLFLCFFSILGVIVISCSY